MNQSLQREITERKRMEEELQKSHDELALRVQQRTQEVNTAYEQLRALSARLVSIREEERTRISREIHDELGQALTGLKMDLSWLAKRPPEDQQSLAGKIRSMSELLDDTIQTVRKISAELRPGVLDDLGLVAAIEWLVEDFRNRTHIQCKFFSDVERSVLDTDLSTALFRILQETLTNVIRHAQATHVTIDIHEDAGTIVLQVEDNGKGIGAHDITGSKSLGLLGIRERAFLFGGEVQISGSEGKGTTVMVRMPLKQTEGYHA